MYILKNITALHIMPNYKLNYRVNPLEKSRVIYGDSVTEDTPILLKSKLTQMVEIKNIKDIGGKWLHYPGFKIFDETILSEKTYSETNYQVWTDRGWSDIHKVIRHQTNKKIYKIITNTGMVKVTEDHSLLSNVFGILKPKDCKIGTKLLERYPVEYEYHYTGLSPSNSYMIGVMFADGEYSEVPDDILNGNQEDAEEFMRGFMSVNEKSKVSDLAMAGFYYISKKIWRNLKLDYVDENLNIAIDEKLSASTIKHIEEVEYNGEYVYDLETSIGRFQAGVGEIIVKNTDSCMVELATPALEKYKEYLQEYEDCINLAPVQEENLKTYKTKAIEEAFEEGKKLAEEVTNMLFKKPINLEFEKVYSPYIILSKKRYLGNYYGKSPYVIDKVEQKGIVLQRRDNPEIVKRIYKGIISPLLDNGNRGIMISVNYLKKELEKLLAGEIALNELVITKALAKGYGKISDDGEEKVGNDDYKSMNLPHVALARNMRTKDPGSAPNIGDRLSYLFVELPGNPKAKLYEKVKDIQSVIDENLKVDYLYYVDNQLYNPITEVLGILYPNIKDVFENASKEYRDRRNEEIKKAKIMKKEPGQLSILKWIGKA